MAPPAPGGNGTRRIAAIASTPDGCFLAVSAPALAEMLLEQWIAGLDAGDPHALQAERELLGEEAGAR